MLLTESTDRDDCFPCLALALDCGTAPLPPDVLFLSPLFTPTVDWIANTRCVPVTGCAAQGWWARLDVTPLAMRCGSPCSGQC